MFNFGLTLIFGAFFYWLYDFIKTYPEIQAELYRLTKEDDERMLKEWRAKRAKKARELVRKKAA